MGPTLVAMATKFGLGAEIQSPTGLFVSLLLGSLAVSFVNFTSKRLTIDAFSFEADYSFLR